MKKLKLILVTILVICLWGCGALMEKVGEMQKKMEKMQETAFSVCDCDVVKLISYEQKNLTTTAYMEVIGTEAKSNKEVAIKINEALKKEVEGYCDIDIFEINFINKGKQESFVIKQCEIAE